MIGFNPRTHTGCDGLNLAFIIGIISFNPRTHTGCDIVANELAQMRSVSIHAPTRGATYV